jgi:hypothetical protein
MIVPRSLLWLPLSLLFAFGISLALALFSTFLSRLRADKTRPFNAPSSCALEKWQTARNAKMQPCILLPPDGYAGRPADCWLARPRRAASLENGSKGEWIANTRVSFLVPVIVYVLEWNNITIKCAALLATLDHCVLLFFLFFSLLLLDVSYTLFFLIAKTQYPSTYGTKAR